MKNDSLLAKEDSNESIHSAVNDHNQLINILLSDSGIDEQLGKC